MTSPFDGMGEILTGALGAPVVHRSATFGAEIRNWHLRVYPQETLPGDDRPVLGEVAELRVPRAEAEAVQPGDEIEAEDGSRYRIAAETPSPSPGRDALILFELEALE